MDFIAFDFETANTNRSSICSIGFAFVENGTLTGSDHILVKPTPDYYDYFNTCLHGIDDRMTKNEKPFKELWNELFWYFDGQIVVAHNASFDCSVLRSALDISDLDYPNTAYHCTFRLAQESLPLSRHTLDVVSKHFKIKLNHHNAESDAIASALIALRLCEKYKSNSLEELSTSLGFKTGKILSETKTYRPFSKK